MRRVLRWEPSGLHTYNTYRGHDVTRVMTSPGTYHKRGRSRVEEGLGLVNPEVRESQYRLYKPAEKGRTAYVAGVESRDTLNKLERAATNSDTSGSTQVLPAETQGYV